MKFLTWVLLFIVIVLGYFLFAPGLNADSSELFISEYVEGSSYNKAIEIYNPGSDPVSLSSYKLESFINGSSVVSAIATSSANIESGSTFVFCNSQASEAILGVCNQTVSGVVSVLAFNGNDTLALAKSDGTIVDAIGQIGFDPGSEWGSGLTSTADNTLRRKCSFVAGDANAADAFDPASQWDGFTLDTFSGLGSHTLCPETPEPTLEPTSSPETTAVPSATPDATESPTSTPSLTTPTPNESPTPSPSKTPEPTSFPSLSPSSIASPQVTPAPTGNSAFFKVFINGMQTFFKLFRSYLFG